MDHTFLTIAMKFDADRLQEVDGVLQEEGKATYNKGYIRNLLRDKGVHFLSITTVPGDPGEPAHLVIESSHDGGKDDALACVATNLKEPIGKIFEAAGISVKGGHLEEYLRSKSIETGQSLFSLPGLNHRGVPGMSVDRIKKEADFAETIREILAAPPGGDTPLETLKEVRRRVAKDDKLNDMMKPEDVSFLQREPEQKGLLSLGRSLIWPAIRDFLWPYLVVTAIAVTYVIWLSSQPGGMVHVVWETSAIGGLLFALGIIVVSLLVAILILGLLGFLLYRRLQNKEKSDEPDDSTPDYETLSKVMEIEDDGDTNHLAGISVMKPGLLRNLTLRLAFWTIREFATRQYRPGFLGDLGTIHFARWVLLPGTNRLLFYSNYGGSWESYLEDFITKAADGLTGVWSNTYGFPRTENLFLEGATDGDRFKRWARRQQRPSYFWYRAYPNKTTRLVRLNAAIRHGLISASTEDEAADWLALFGSRRRKPNSIEVQEIQALLFGAMRHLSDGTCQLLRLPDDPAKAREWLHGIERDITFEDRKPVNLGMMLAFTERGLRRLGLDEQNVRQFPTAFQQGMDEKKRAKDVLKDTGEDKPADWRWGNAEKPVDAALIVYAKKSKGRSFLDKEVGKRLDALGKLGGGQVYEITTRCIPPEGNIEEAFGFVDGVSQPIIRGTRRWSTQTSPLHAVEPGEFILGYPDNRGYLPTTPTLPSTADPENILPAFHPEPVEHDWPLFDRTTANNRHDIGRNGSYLVIRQLEQNVDLFEKRVKNLAQEFSKHPGCPPDLTSAQLEKWIKAKMVGRWPDGTSLVRYPYEPGTGWDGEKKDKVKPDNEFLLGEEDPEGYRCPFSAHIRRTNPRESFEPGSQDQLAISNRHRILRVGRPYEESGAGKTQSKGLLFMCLNGDIERQFEFIQHTWVMSRLFHGVHGDVDAILGRGYKGGQLTVPTPRGPVVIKPFADVVTVRGGAYFFLPSRSAIRYLARLP